MLWNRDIEVDTGSTDSQDDPDTTFILKHSSEMITNLIIPDLPSEKAINLVLTLCKLQAPITTELLDKVWQTVPELMPELIVVATTDQSTSWILHHEPVQTDNDENGHIFAHLVCLTLLRLAIYNDAQSAALRDLFHRWRTGSVEEHIVEQYLKESTSTIVIRAVSSPTSEECYKYYLRQEPARHRMSRLFNWFVQY